MGATRINRSGKATVGPASNGFKAEALCSSGIPVESRLYPLMWVCERKIDVSPLAPFFASMSTLTSTTSGD